MSSSFLSVLIQRQAGKYGDRVALRYRDYKTENMDSSFLEPVCRNCKNSFECIDRIRCRCTGKYSCLFSKQTGVSVRGFGAFGVRAVTVPFYATSSEAQVHYMVGDAEIRYIFVGEQLQYDVAFRVMRTGATETDYNFRQGGEARRARSDFHLFR